MRGNNQQPTDRILFLIDGLPSCADSLGLALWKTLPVSFGEIKQIEVLKGPASVIDGFHAFDGAINLITQDPQDMKGMTIQAGAGKYSTERRAAIRVGKAGDLGYHLFIGHDQQQQWRDRSALAFQVDRFNGTDKFPAQERRDRQI